MKPVTKPILTSFVAATALAATSALAQDALVREQAQSELSGDWVLGAPVVTLEGNSIGSVEDVIIDKEEGRVTAAVVSVGGFLGFGAKQIAVDWNELRINWDANEISLDITREEAEAAEEYAYRERESPPAPESAAGTGTGADPGVSGGLSGGATGGASGGGATGGGGN